MNKKTRKRIGNRIERLESRQMMAAGDVLVQLTRAGIDFGADVDLSGDILVVGAPGDDTVGNNVGRVYVYRLNGTPNPSLIRTIENPLPAALNFGRKLDLNDSQLIVSAKDTAFIFDLDNPAVQQTITDPTNNIADDFANDVAISDEYYVMTDVPNGFGPGNDEVHAYDVQTNTRLLLSSTAGGSGLSSVAVDGHQVAIGFGGSTQIYDATTGNLVDSFDIPGNVLGYTRVAIQGDRILAGATGVDPQGSAYVFDIGQTNPTYTWVNPNPVSAGGFGQSEQFGGSVSIDGRIAVVGEPAGESADAGSGDSPAMAIFDTTTGQRLAAVVAPAAPLADTSPTYRFGRSIAVSGQYVAVGANSTIFVLESGLAELNLKPVISGLPIQVTYTENSSGVRVAQNAVVADTDSHNFAAGHLTATITNNSQATDVLAIRHQGNGAGQIGVSSGNAKFGGVVIGTISGGSGSNPLVVALNSKATPAAVQALVRNVIFKSTSQSPSTSSRTVRLTVSDGDGGTSAPKSLTVNVTAENDAPVLNTSLNPKLSSIAEDNLNPSGTAVSSLLAGAVADPDSSAKRGIAVTSASKANGTWEYSRNGGQSWINMGIPSSSAALLIPASARVRFVPKLDFNGQVKLFYKAWDQTLGQVGGTLNTTGNTGGTRSLSTATESATVTVTPVNDAPVVNTAANPTLTPVLENATSPAGTLIKNLIASSISDVDAGDIKGIAITNANSTNGTWQYSLNGTTWKSLGIVFESQARLLPASATARIRFIPNANFTGQANFTFRAWDGTDGTAGSTLSTTGRTGGTKTFSSFFDIALITVTPS